MASSDWASGVVKESTDYIPEALLATVHQEHPQKQQLGMEIMSSSFSMSAMSSILNYEEATIVTFGSLLGSSGSEDGGGDNGNNKGLNDDECGECHTPFNSAAVLLLFSSSLLSLWGEEEDGPIDGRGFRTPAGPVWGVSSLVISH